VPIILIMGIITGCVGGLLRDIVANEVPLLIRSGKLYITAAFAGAGAALIADAVWPSEVLSLMACIVTCFALRAGSLVFGWQLPVYKPRPPRP
jgi:uncharacterized membrane protein YeiH